MYVFRISGEHKILAYRKDCKREFYMKNKILLVTMAAALVLGMTLAGCKDSDDGAKANTDPKTLIIEGITGISKTYLSVLLMPDENSNPVAACRANNASSVTFPLYNVRVGSNWS
jgi:hypothetical protein